MRLCALSIAQFACLAEAQSAEAGRRTKRACTIVVQTARLRRITQRMSVGTSDFHTLFHNFCEDLEAS
jgi:hypothetical protein